MRNILPLVLFAWVVGLNALSLKAEEEIVTIKIFCCAQNSNYPPFFKWPQWQKEPVGHEIDIAREVSKYLKAKIEFAILPPDYDRSSPRTDMLLHGHAKLVVSCFTITESRKKALIFSHPYRSDGLGVLVRSDSKIKTRNDLDGKTIVAFRHTTAHPWVSKNLPGAKIVSDYPKDFQGTPHELIERGLADAYINDYSQLISIAHANKDLRILPKRLTSEVWGIAAKKDEQALIDEVNRALDQMKKSGQLQEIHDKWLKVQQLK